MNDALVEKCDVLVVGAGPGGIAAAVTAARGGKKVVMVDDNFGAGGQIWRGQQAHPPTRQARQWFEALAQSKVERRAGWRVFAVLGGKRLLVETPEQMGAKGHEGLGGGEPDMGARIIQYERLILATGARELFVPFPGWTTPGVLGAGGLQAMVKAGLEVRGKRVVVAGSGPLLLAVAAQLRKAGAVVPVIAEQTSGKKLRGFALRLAGSPGKLMQAAALRMSLLGTKYATDSWPTEVRAAGKGAGRLEVELSLNGRVRRETCDFLACGFGLVPNVELATELGCALTDDLCVRVDERQATNAEGVYAVGEMTGIGGIEKALLEGQIAGHAAAGDLAAAEAMLTSRAKIVAFSQALEETFAPRAELFRLAKDETVVCRCEDVSLGALRARMSCRDAKLQTRCGMGPCQGRVCGPALRRILGAGDVQVRPPIWPVAVGRLVEPR